jgi:SAM-dependent methyltransferase
LDAQNIEVWSRTAPVYALGAEALTGPAVEPLLDAAGVARGTDLLDVGTGPGTVVGAAIRRGAMVTGLDLSEAMVAAARNRYPGVDVRVGNANHLPFDSASFDAVCLAFCVLVLPDPRRALVEARRVLRPGGRIGLTIWASSGLEAMEVGGGALTELGATGPDWSSAPLFGAEPETLIEALDEAGFEVPFARRFGIEIRLTSAEPLVEHFSSVFDLDTSGTQLRSRLAEKINETLAGRRADAGVVVLHNEVVLASAPQPVLSSTSVRRKPAANSERFGGHASAVQAQHSLQA